MNCPGCGVGLSKAESTEGCPLCDWTPQRAERLKERKAVRSQARRSTDVWADILTDPLFGYATRLTRYLIDQYRDEVSLWKDRPIVWRNRQASCHFKDVDDRHYITFSYHSVRDSHDEGMREYKTWRWIWEDGLKDGLEGVYQEVVHEFAHSLQVERNGRHYGKAHTMIWAEAVMEIQTLVPFGDTLKFS